MRYVICKCFLPSVPCLLIPLTIIKVLLDHLAKWYLPAEAAERVRQKPGVAGNNHREEAARD